MHHRRSTWRTKRGFTLIEVSIVVVAVGILAALALVGYIRYRRTARMAEATNLVGAIKSEQEAYKSEKGLYASVSKTADSFYPAANPGPFATEWGADCDGCYDPQGWRTLNVKPSSPVMYGYATVAGVGADVGGDPSAMGPLGNGTNAPSMPGGGGGDIPSGPGSSDNDCASIAPTQPYFLIKAKGDTDGDGIAATVIALSCSNQVIMTNAGE